MCVPRFGDRSSSVLVARGVFAWYQAKERHESTRRLEAVEVVQLRHERHGRYRVDSSEAAQPRNRLAVRLFRAERNQLLFQSTNQLLKMLDRSQVVVEDRAIRLVLEVQTPKPAPVRFGPR